MEALAGNPNCRAVAEAPSVRAGRFTLVRATLACAGIKGDDH